MQQKIIFFDIDGTILSHRNYKISSSTSNAIRQARANGHLAFVNTGRTYSAIDPDIKEVGFDGYVCGCGTYISCNSSVLFHTALEPKICRDVIEDLRSYQINAVLEGSTAIYFDSRLQNKQLDLIRSMYASKMFQVLDWDSPDVSFDKFCIWIDSPKALQSFQQKYENQFEFIYRDHQFLEIIPRGYSKATGIEYLLNHYHIPQENAYALGDSANDFTMLSYVKHSIGMGNSEELIRNIVSYLTKDVDEGGVEHALRHFHII